MKTARQKKESGYAMLALLVGLTISLIVLASMASKPSAQFVSQRENEEEMFFRAQQVSFAIQTYAQLKGGLAPQNLPTKLEDLLNEFNVQGRTIHIVRKSSMTDPLTGREWKAVRLGDPMIREFYRIYVKVMAEQQAQAMAAGGAAAAMQQRQQQMPPLLVMAAQAGGVNIANPNAGEEDEEKEGKASSASGFSLDSDSESRPIVGVVSTFKKPMIRNYFGIESYDKALMIAGVQSSSLPTMSLPLGGGQGVGGPTTTPSETSPDSPLKPGRCPPGSTDPTCPRVQNPNPSDTPPPPTLTPGRCPPGSNDPTCPRNQGNGQ